MVHMCSTSGASCGCLIALLNVPVCSVELKDLMQITLHRKDWHSLQPSHKNHLFKKISKKLQISFLRKGATCWYVGVPMQRGCGRGQEGGWSRRKRNSKQPSGFSRVRLPFLTAGHCHTLSPAECLPYFCSPHMELRSGHFRMKAQFQGSTYGTILGSRGRSDLWDYLKTQSLQHYSCFS